VAQTVGRGIALLFHDRGTRRGEWSATRPGRTLPSGKTRYPIYRRLGGPQGRPRRVENLRDSIPDRPVLSQSLYRLSYPAHKNNTIRLKTEYIYDVSFFGRVRKPNFSFDISLCMSVRTELDSQLTDFH